jgi:hypothetical protein
MCEVCRRILATAAALRWGLLLVLLMMLKLVLLLGLRMDVHLLRHVTGPVMASAAALLVVGRQVRMRVRCSDRGRWMVAVVNHVAPSGASVPRVQGGRRSVVAQRGGCAGLIVHTGLRRCCRPGPAARNNIQWQCVGWLRRRRWWFLRSYGRPVGTARLCCGQRMLLLAVAAAVRPRHPTVMMFIVHPHCLGSLVRR